MVSSLLLMAWMGERIIPIVRQVSLCATDAVMNFAPAVLHRRFQSGVRTTRLAFDTRDELRADHTSEMSSDKTTSGKNHG
jgi:hypothetical protein